MRRTLFLLSCLTLCLGPSVGASDGPQDVETPSDTVGWRYNGLETPVNQRVTPAGTQVQLKGIRPNALALSPDGRLLVTSGITRELIVLSPDTGKILQRVPLPPDQQLPGAKPISDLVLNPNPKDKLSLTGLTFSPDGRRIYLSNVNGDIKVFAVGKDARVSGLYSIPLPRVNKPDREEELPMGLALSPDGKKLYVALNVTNQLAEIESDTGKILRTWDVGVSPFGVAVARGKAYVSNWGGRRPGAGSAVGPIGRNGTVRVDDRSIANEGSISIINLTGPANPSEILVGLRPCALALSPNGRYLAVANSGSDSISVLDTSTDRIVETLSARQSPGDPFGAQPNALAFDDSPDEPFAMRLSPFARYGRGHTLFVCNGTQNAVAVFQFHPGASKLLGLIPAGWFPGGVVFDARRGSLDVANLKSLPESKESPRPGRGNGPGFNSQQKCGSLSLIPAPSAKDLAACTRTALSNLRYPLLAQARLPARPGRPAQPVPERVGEPSVFQHVIYIIKENRSYDQVLGDVPQGDGDPDLCVFGEEVTPNQHRLVNDFVLLDNTYCCGILSADGHQWADSAIATDYLERSFAGWPRSYPAGGEITARDALAYSPAGFVWNNALAHGRTVCDFGEFTTGKHAWKEDRRRPPSWLDSYRDFLNGSNAVKVWADPDIEALAPYVVTNYPGFNLNIPDVMRAACFIRKLKEFEEAGQMPNLLIVWLPDDHTSGSKFGEPTPAAQVADNDLALGQIIQAVSHSPFWTNTCLFGIEDDPQNGWDHISGYRTTAYIVSPYTVRHATVHTQYNQTSLIRTMELMLGLPPLNQMDATATPMFDCFTNTPDFTAYEVQTNRIPLDEMNPNPREIGDSVLRQDAYASARLPLDKEDQCPEDLLNRILWHSTKGSRAPYPAWAITAHPDDD